MWQSNDNVERALRSWVKDYKFKGEIEVPGAGWGWPWDEGVALRWRWPWVQKGGLGGGGHRMGEWSWNEGGPMVKGGPYILIMFSFICFSNNKVVYYPQAHYSTWWHKSHIYCKSHIIQHKSHCWHCWLYNLTKF